MLQDHIAALLPRKQPPLYVRWTEEAAPPPGCGPETSATVQTRLS